MINLLTNAIRYSPGQLKIEVYLNKENEQIKVGVRDYGVGIAPDKLNDIFSRFYRVDDNNSKVSGLGIGLYLCYDRDATPGQDLGGEPPGGRQHILVYAV